MLMATRFRTITAAAAAVALGWAPTPALAQEYRMSGFDGPAGTTAALNLRVPLGGTGEAARPTVGLTVSYGQATGGYGRDERHRQIRLADLRLGAGGIRRAQLAGFDLARPDRAMRLSGSDKKNTLLLLLLIAAGMTAIVLTADGDDSELRNNLPDTDR